MASGNFNLTTWYAKRIIGDSAASTAANALLQTGTGVTGDTWILSRTDRTTEYGIKYIYDATNAQDKIAFIGGNPSAVKASIQLATGSAILKGHLYLAGTAGAVADTTSQIQFTNADASTTYLYISANTSSTLTFRKASGNATGQIILKVQGISQFTHDSDATACSASGAGALFVAGGAAIAKKLYVGGGMSVTGTATIYKMVSAGDHSSQWRTGRDNAIFSMSLASGKYYPMLSAQTADGTWEMGTYDSTSYANRLLFNYVSNTNYNNNNNTATTISFLSTGELWVGHEKTDLSSDHKIGIVNGSGEIYMFSSVTATDTRGIYIPAHGTGSAKNVFVVDTNNAVTYTGGSFSGSITVKGTSGNARQVNVKHTDIGVQVGLIISGSTTGAHGVYSWGYYDTNANPPAFVSDERYLISRNQKGEVIINGCAITNTFDIRNSAATPTIGFRSSNGIQARGGEIYLNMATTTGVYRADRFYFKVYAYSSTSGQTLSNYDLYRLPAARTNRTSNQTYEIRTSRDNNYGVYYPTGFGSRGSAIGAGDTSVGSFITSWISTTYGQVNFTGNDPITPSTTSPGKVSIRLGGRFYGNDGNSPAMLMNKVGTASATASMIWGMGTPDGESTGINWIRTTSEGIVPYEAGAAGSGHSSLGAPDWYFNSAFIDNIKGTLFGSVNNITSLTKGTLPDSTRYQNLWTNFETGADTTNSGTQRIGGHISSWVDNEGTTGLTLKAYQYAANSSAGNTLSVQVKADGTCSTNSNSNFIVRKTGDTYVEARSDTTGCRIEIDTQDNGKHGLWSSGYWNAISNTYVGSPLWMLYRDTDGQVKSSSSINVGNNNFISTKVGGNGMWITGTHQGAFQVNATSTANAGAAFASWFSGYTNSGSWGIGSLSGYNDLYFSFGTHTNYNNNTNTTSQVRFGSDGKVYGAVWNDYAEYRAVSITAPGYCVTETSNGQMIKTTKRLQAGCKITSDTYGMCIGQTLSANTPIAIAGRALVYPYRSREEYELGAAVCSAPGGKVDIMTREEIREYPERIIGTVSEIPDYDIWYSGGGAEGGNIPINVDGRIWIYVR